MASCDAEGCIAARRHLAWPHLEKLLARLAPASGGDDDGGANTLSMPHERALARAWGLHAPDGGIPWAAWQLAQAGRDPQGAAWAWITPCHWRVGRDHIAMDAPQQLALDERDSQALLAAMRPYFEEDGIALEYEAPTRWLARGEVFRGLASASLDRVVGRIIDDWLPRSQQARTLRRLQQEMQMLLYTHPINEERLARGLPPVNSFWVSGTGALPASPSTAQPPPGLQVAHELHNPALQQDWAGWASAWQQIDAQQCARLLESLDQGEAVALTLCGERQARTWHGRGAGLLPRLAAALRGKQAAAVLDTL
ncbi:phosphoglycerate mutase [Ramlibacter tataouinensis]|uniref:phosphoglycerate mutase n=1 Tax=Ramlibacter tataouinensis TaxID=94132 RepID=UPI001D100228|nr:phosphoglycerate mutase [Ramlibacter tataouinensis]